MKIFKTIVWFILILVVMFLLLSWMDKHDAKIMESAEKYEECVKVEYGVTPSYYYNEQGHYPECNYE